MTTVLQPRRNGDGENINDGVCVVCLDRPHNAGFSHGDRYVPSLNCDVILFFTVHTIACASLAHILFIYLTEAGAQSVDGRLIASFQRNIDYSDFNTIE